MTEDTPGIFNEGGRTEIHTCQAALGMQSCQYAYPLGKAIAEPALLPAHIEDKNGHILPFVRFVGGSLELSHEALRILAEALNSGGEY